MRVWATTSEDDGLESLEKVWRQIKAGALICDQKGNVSKMIPRLWTSEDRSLNMEV